MLFLYSFSPPSLVLTMIFTQHLPLLEGITQRRRRQDEASRRTVDAGIAAAVFAVFNRPGVAGAVLKSALSLINLFIQ